MTLSITKAMKNKGYFGGTWKGCFCLNALEGAFYNNQCFIPLIVNPNTSTAMQVLV